MKRPRRTPTEQIEDAFMDLSLSEQIFSLRMLNSLHRQKIRAEAEKPVKDPTDNGQGKLGEEQQ